MRRLLIFRAILFLTAASAVVSSGGCGIYNPRHGMILRGDWSLEMNRVPWLNSRTQSYDEVGRAGCSEGMILQPPAQPESCVEVSGMPGACGPQMAAHRCPPPPLVCRKCAGAHGAGAAASPPQQQVALSRFHPVPTRPVFTPWNCPTADPGVGSPQEQQAPGMQPPRELIPTPAASQSTTQRSRANSQVKTTAWVFKPEEASDQTLASR